MLGDHRICFEDMLETQEPMVLCSCPEPLPLLSLRGCPLADREACACVCAEGAARFICPCLSSMIMEVWGGWWGGGVVDLINKVGIADLILKQAPPASWPKQAWSHAMGTGLPLSNAGCLDQHAATRSLLAFHIYIYMYMICPGYLKLWPGRKDETIEVPIYSVFAPSRNQKTYFWGTWVEYYTLCPRV